MTLFLVVSTISMIVIPKIRRAKSGERIVMSKLLDPKLSRRQSSIGLPATAARLGGVLDGSNLDDPSGPEGALSGSEQTTITKNCVFRTPIVLNYEDPPPRRIERQLFALKDLISEFTNNSLEGRHITLSLWNMIISDVDRLNGDLQAMEFNWNEAMEKLEYKSDDDSSL